MGAWGIGPWDTDAAGDWSDGTYKKWLMTELAKYDGNPQVIRGIVETIISHIGTYHGPNQEQLEQTVEALDKNCTEEWMSSCQEPAMIATSVERQRSILILEINTWKQIHLRRSKGQRQKIKAAN